MRRIGIALAAVQLVAGCGGGPALPTVRQTSASPTPTPPPAPPTVTLAFAGDVHFTGRTGPLLEDPDTAFGPIAPVLRAADFTMLNLETAVTTRGTPEEKQYVFRAPPSTFDALQAAGVDVVSLANNHGLDYGRVGLADTLASAEAAGVPLVGAGTNAAEAYAPWFTTVNGVRLAVFGFTQVGPANSGFAATQSRSGLAYVVSDAQIAAAAESIRKAHKRADVVIIFMHWGIEREPCPTQHQRRTARVFADAGATVVVGAHPHILQGAGWLGETYVAYSLGNFVWYSNTSNLDTGVLRLTLTGASVSGVDFVPAIISRTNGQPIPADGAEAARIHAKLDGLRDCAGLSAVAPPAAPDDPPVRALSPHPPHRTTRRFERCRPTRRSTHGRRAGIRFGRPVGRRLEFASVAGLPDGMRT